MKRPSIRMPLLGVALALGAASVTAARGPRLLQLERPHRATHVTSAAGTLADVINGGRERRINEIRRRLRERASGTYIGEILRSRDSALARWPERLGAPIRVWVQPSSRVADWQESFVRMAHEAFAEWTATGIPVRFHFVADSADADAHLVWIDHFDEPISGKTRWARDEGYWITDADIQIAVHHNQGMSLDTLAVKAITLHEVGHLLGLDHSADVSNIMTPRVRVRDLSAADRATMRLLYSLPPGPVR